MRNLIVTIGVILFIGCCGVAGAQMTVPIGEIPRTNDTGPYMWAIGGHEIVNVRASSNGFNPYMRAALLDARTVEILSRTQAPPLRASDIRAVKRNGRDMILVRRWLLFDVRPEDARAEKTNTTALAEKWAGSVRRTLPAIAPKPSRFGI